MTAACPVCRRQVEASEYTGRVRRHDDTADRTCPMSGRRVPLETIERQVAYLSPVVTIGRGRAVLSHLTAS